MINKKIINCPKCSKKVRVPVGKHIRYMCPHCNERVESDDRSEAEKALSRERENNSNFSLGNAIIQRISLIVALPLFLLFHKLIPNPDWIFNLDRILIGLAVVFLLIYLYKKSKIFLLSAVVASIVWLLYGSFFGDYGFINAFNDYKEIIYAMF